MFDARIVPGGVAGVELAEHRDLQREPLRDRLDDEVGVRGLLERTGEREPRQRRVGLLAGQLAALDRRASKPVAAGRDVLTTALASASGSTS